MYLFKYESFDYLTIYHIFTSSLFRNTTLTFHHVDYYANEWNVPLTSSLTDRREVKHEKRSDRSSGNTQPLP